MDDEGLFGPGSVTWRVMVEPVMWVGGLRALYLQSLHPRVMRGTYQNSALFDRSKAWARFLRTAEFVTIRTYGTKAEVERVGQRVRRIHAGLTGHDPDTGRTFRLDEPDGLLWVHCAEIDSSVEIAYRAGVLNAGDAERFVAESTRAAAVVGLDPAEVPSTRGELADYFAGIRPELYACAEARQGLLNSFIPPTPLRQLPLRALAPAANLVALSSLPPWARRLLGLPVLPGTALSVDVQLRALRRLSRAVGRASTEELIDRARTAAHRMAPAPNDRGATVI